MSLARRLSAATSSTDDTLTNDPPRSVHGLSALLRRASTTSPNQRRPLTKPKPEPNMSAGIKLFVPIPTDEFEALPIAIQRKYFSSEERLAIAQQSAAEKRQRTPSKKAATVKSSSKGSVLDVLPKRRKTSQKTLAKQQRRSSLPPAWNNTSDAQPSTWFDSLPDKVKRSQFSQQEIDALDALKVHEFQRPRTSSASKPNFDPIAWDSQITLQQQQQLHQHQPPSLHSPSASVSASTRSNQTSRSAPHNSNSNSPASNSAASSRSTPASPAVPNLSVTSPHGHTAAMKRPSLRRPFIKPIPLPPPVLAPEPYLPSPDTSSYIDLWNTLAANPDLAHGARLEDETTPTQEREEAYLDVTSVPPIWYDSKLNFDFDRDYPKSTLSAAGSGSQRAMSPSVSDAASFDTSGPLTPISPATLPQIFEHPLSRIPPVPRPTSSGNTSDTAVHNGSVTNFSHPQHLTHRDSMPRLRSQRKARHLVDGFYESQQEQPYSITIDYNKHDALALEALPVCDDVTGAHGAFAVADEHQSRGFRKVLKVIRGH